MLDVCLLGTGGMMPLPNRWLTAALMRYNGSSLLIDCGEGTQLAIREAGQTFKPIDTICFTHYHADHVSGLPGLLLSMGNAERTEPVTMIGPRGLERVVTALRTIAPELPFEIRFLEISEPEEDFEQNGYHVHAFKVNHNIPCYGYSVEIRRAGRFQTERVKELGIPQKYWSRLQKGETIRVKGGDRQGGSLQSWDASLQGQETHTQVDSASPQVQDTIRENATGNEDIVYTPDMVLGPPRKGIKVTYCTDTRPTDLIAESAAGSDLFICEGMYAEKEKIAKAKQYKHMTFYEAAKLARAADVGEMWLTHFSPSLVRGEDYMPKVREIFPNSHLGSDGKSVELTFADE